MNNRRQDYESHGRSGNLSSSHPSGYNGRNSMNSGAGPPPENSGQNFYPQNSQYAPQAPTPYGVPQQLYYQNDPARQQGGYYNGMSAPPALPPRFPYDPYAQHNWDPRSFPPQQPPNMMYPNLSMPYPPMYAAPPPSLPTNNNNSNYPNQVPEPTQHSSHLVSHHQQSQQSTWIPPSAPVPPVQDAARHRESYNTATDVAPSKADRRDSSPVRKDAVPSASKSRETTSEPADEKEPEKETKKPVPIMVGKRRGGRVLPTGVVKKQRTGTSTQGRTDAWGQYMAEVKKYKEQSCEEERKNRPLVK